MSKSKTLLLTLSVALLLTSIVEQAAAEVIAVIVPRSHNVRPTEANELSLVFWRKKLYWADGKRIQTLNYPANHPLRRQFSISVLKSTPENQTDYWNGLYFHGISPPHVVGSQEAMLRFVAETPGAIGYIDVCKLDDRVKPLVWISAEGNVLGSAPEYNCSE
jgi:hypothetical protein